MKVESLSKDRLVSMEMYVNYIHTTIKQLSKTVENADYEMNDDIVEYLRKLYVSLQDFANEFDVSLTEDISEDEDPGAESVPTDIDADVDIDADDVNVDVEEEPDDLSDEDLSEIDSEINSLLDKDAPDEGLPHLDKEEAPAEDELTLPNKGF